MRYRGSDHDPFLLSGPPDMRGGVYLLLFTGEIPDHDPLAVRLVLHAVAKLHLDINFLSWRRLDPPLNLDTRLVGGEGRSGAFLQRLVRALPRLDGVAPVGTKPQIVFDTARLVNHDVAAWLLPEADGFYVKDFARADDFDALTRWRSAGALDAH